MARLRFPYVFFAHEWRMPKVMAALFALEFPLTVATLTLFGIAQGNTYRTKLWQNGYDKGFNSAPNSILYDYANYRPAHIPVVWSTFLTDFNVVVSVLSMFILLVKATMFIMHIWIPMLSLVVHAVLAVLYGIAIRNQSAPDMTDPDHPSPGLPWYLSKGCSYAEPGNYGYCMQARASFAISCVMIALFSTYFFFACWSLMPTQAERQRREEMIEMKKLETYEPEPVSREEQREMNRQLFLGLPKTPTTPFGRTPGNPMTPRTVAFTQLSGGDKPFTSNGMGPSRSLPFRQQFTSDTPDGS